MLEQLLANWARWCKYDAWTGPHMPITCESGERAYLWLCFAARHQFDDIPIRYGPPDERSAALVENGVQALPDHERVVVRVEYVLASPRHGESESQFFERKRRQCLLPAWYYSRCLFSAREQLRQVLCPDNELHQNSTGHFVL